MQLSVAKLKVFLDQFNEGKLSSDQLAVECAIFLKVCGQEDEEEEHVKVESKQVDGLRKKYQSISEEVNAFIVQQGQHAHLPPERGRGGGQVDWCPHVHKMLFPHGEDF